FRCGVAMADIAALACHGQTVWHQPSPARCGDGEYRGTMQIVSAATLAARTGCPVVSDFRTADMAAGGQGAPLVPYADWVLLSRAGEARIMLNIGGIANVTYLPSCDRLDRIAAFDTGPGNMVVDGVVRVLTHGAKAYDVDGAWAAAGRPSQVVVESVMATCPFLRQPPPRSTGREQFGRAFVEETFLPSCREARLSDADTVATATSLTAHTIADALSRWPIGETPADQNVADARATVIVGGGGARNSTMMRMLAERLAPARLTTHEEFGIPNDAKEAIAFAILGYATLCGLPSNVPSATGAAYPAVLGSITPAPGRAAAKSGRGDRGATSGD
ncbi:MAG: anhydro-N-acetylmuramic acid kinase, partial [Armatimonadetes bacterium]|nr:anhydro-N-acetylmuramic acid kinase [Armatimonadota bacterium]